VALLFFLPGVPGVYYGDEFGLEAVKENRPDGDDAVRPAMPSERGLFDNPHPEVEQVYRRMIGIRRRHPWLTDAVIETRQVANSHVVVRSRARHGAESLTLSLNLADEPLALGTGWAVLEAEPTITDGAVAPHGWAIVVD
jgi:glycosidase